MALYILTNDYRSCARIVSLKGPPTWSIDLRLRAQVKQNKKNILERLKIKLHLFVCIIFISHSYYTSMLNLVCF